MLKSLVADRFRSSDKVDRQAISLDYRWANMMSFLANLVLENARIMHASLPSLGYL